MLSCEIHLCTRRSWFHVNRWLHSIRVEPPSYVGSECTARYDATIEERTPNGSCGASL